MQTASSRIWTQVNISIYYNDNHYTTSASWKFEVIYANKYQVFLSNSNNFYRPIWLIDGTWTGTTTPRQSRPESNGIYTN